MDNRLEHFIKNMANHQPLRLDAFWDIAMQHPDYGYYVQKNPLGQEGDFTTAPEISQVFGAVIGYYFYDYWCRIGQPNPCYILELGAGRGVLMKDFMDVVAQYPAFYNAITYHIIDSNIYLQSQQQKLAVNHAITYHDYDYIYNMDEVTHFVIANEFIDALPIRQACFKHNAWYESHILYNKDSDILYQDAPILWHDSTIKPHITPYPNIAPCEGDYIEYCPAISHIIPAISKHIHTYKGVLFLADYGYYPSQYGESVQALYKHQYSPLLANIGQQDITAHVNFEHVIHEAIPYSISPYLYTQHDFLQQMGGDVLAYKLYKKSNDSNILHGYKRLIDSYGMGQLFKILTLEHTENNYMRSHAL